jgi:hypothetical protein
MFVYYISVYYMLCIMLDASCLSIIFLPMKNLKGEHLKGFSGSLNMNINNESSIFLKYPEIFIILTKKYVVFVKIQYFYCAIVPFYFTLQ